MPKKRGNNEGSIRQRNDGTWEGRYVSGYGADGKTQRRSVFANTQEELQKKLRKALTQLDRGEYVEPSKMTVGQWLDTWFTVYGRPRWRDSTAAIHHDNIRLHLRPAMGRHLLQKLRPDHVQAFVNRQAKQDYTPASIRKQIEPLKQALKQAVKDQLIMRSPAEAVSLPSPNQKEIEVLTIDEQKLLAPHIPDTVYGRAIRFILGTGLRASELCGLRWQDINGDIFTIRQGVQFVRNIEAKEGDSKHKLSIAPPKTKAGRRTIPITPAMRAVLETQRRAQKEDRMRAGSAWQGATVGQGESYIFATEVGTPMDRTNLGRALRARLSEAGLKIVAFMP